MMFQPSDDSIKRLFEMAAELADDQLDEMSDEECILMVRSYVEVMSDWQPEIQRLSDKPGELALSVLTLNKLFMRAFKKAYGYTERRIEATEALERAFNS